MILCRINGYSMYPLLRQGQKVLLRPPGEHESLRPGVIVACRAGNGEPAIHRVVKVAADGVRFITMGDNCRRADPVWRRSQVLGELIAAEDGDGVWREPRSFIAPMMVAAQRWGLARPMRFFFRHFRNAGWRRVIDRQKWLVDDEESGMTFLIDPTRHSRYSLTPVAREIWEHLRDGKSEPDIVRALRAVYTNIPPDELRADVARTIGDLRRLRLI
ncbi:PqqD family peptide modification chaperone [Candidatus Sumerlaeota bacterium]|nr:PqqD family peptide modification chaperone [Candidatus Sumerlaeota bacterium]